MYPVTVHVGPTMKINLMFLCRPLITDVINMIISLTHLWPPLWDRVCNEFIEIIANMDHVQQQLDWIYKDLCKCIFTEMDAHLNYRDTDKTVRKRFKKYKPYWSDHLTQLWRDVAASEKAFRKSNRILYSHHSLREIYLAKQRIFDKALRDTERSYNRHIADQIEDCTTNDPKQFWDHIQRLGPQKSKEIHLKGYNDLGVTCNINNVLNKWRADFQNLYNAPDADNEVF